MAISRVTANDTRNTSATTTVTTTYANTPTLGNTMIASVAGNNTPSNITVSDSNGNWTQIGIIANTPGGSVLTALFSLTAVGSQPKAITADSGGASSAMWLNIYEYTGLGNNLLDQRNSSNMAVGGTNSNGGSITTTVANELLFTNMAGTGIFTAPSINNSFSLRLGTPSGNLRLQDADRIVSSTLTVNPQFSWTTTRTMGQIVASFKAPPSYTGGILPVM